MYIIDKVKIHFKKKYFVDDLTLVIGAIKSMIFSYKTHCIVYREHTITGVYKKSHTSYVFQIT